MKIYYVSNRLVEFLENFITTKYKNAKIKEYFSMMKSRLYKLDGLTHTNLI